METSESSSVTTPSPIEEQHTSAKTGIGIKREDNPFDRLQRMRIEYNLSEEKWKQYLRLIISHPKAFESRLTDKELMEFSDVLQEGNNLFLLLFN